MPTVPCSSHILLLGLACICPGSIRREAHTSFLALLVTVLASLMVPNPPPYIRIHAHARSYTTSFLQSPPYLHPRSNAQLTFVHENTCASTVYTHAQRTYAHTHIYMQYKRDTCKITCTHYTHAHTRTRTHTHTYKTKDIHTQTLTHTQAHTHTQTQALNQAFTSGGQSYSQVASPAGD